MILKGVFDKNEWGYTAKKTPLIATNLTSICCVYPEKNAASIQIQKVATFESDRKRINLIPNKSFRYYN